VLLSLNSSLFDCDDRKTTSVVCKRVLWQCRRPQDAHNVDSSVSEARDNEEGGEEDDDEDEEDEEDDEGSMVSLSFPPFEWPSSV